MTIFHEIELLLPKCRARLRIISFLSNVEDASLYELNSNCGIKITRKMLEEMVNQGFLTKTLVNRYKLNMENEVIKELVRFLQKIKYNPFNSAQP